MFVTWKQTCEWVSVERVFWAGGIAVEKVLSQERVDCFHFQRITMRWVVHGESEQEEE